MQGRKTTRLCRSAQSCEGEMRMKASRLARKAFARALFIKPLLKPRENARGIRHAEPQHARLPAWRKDSCVLYHQLEGLNARRSPRRRLRQSLYTRPFDLA